MKLKSLTIEHFGPFTDYRVNFPSDDNICLLLTGRNNEGKSTIINALRLLHNATKVAMKGKPPYIKELLKKDTEGLNIPRMVHNYTGEKAIIRGTFSNDSELSVVLDPDSNSVSCDFLPNIPSNACDIFGFIPPLGQIAEEEYVLNRPHLLKSLDTTLAPR